jgi:hypothetical protein
VLVFDLSCPWPPWSASAARGLPGAGRWAVAVEDLGFVKVPRSRRPVGVQDQSPAPTMDHHLVVKEAQQHAIFDAGRAAVLLVLDVVDLAGRRGLVAPAGPPAALVAEDDGVAAGMVSA